MSNEPYTTTIVGDVTEVRFAVRVHHYMTDDDALAVEKELCAVVEEGHMLRLDFSQCETMVTDWLRTISHVLDAAEASGGDAEIVGIRESLLGSADGIGLRQRFEEFFRSDHSQSGFGVPAQLEPE